MVSIGGTVTLTHIEGTFPSDMRVAAEVLSGEPPSVRLQHIPAASGAKYGLPDDTTTHLWSAGTAVQIRLNGIDFAETTILEIPLPDDAEGAR